MKTTWMAGIWVWMAMCLFAGEILLCPKCGYEYQEGDRVCAHCGHELPAQAIRPDIEKAEEIEEIAPVIEKPHGDISAGMVRAEYRQAIKAYKENAFWRAWLLARNAEALAAATESTGKINRQTAELEATCATRAGQTRIVCPLCEGKGMRKVPRMTIRGDVLLQDTPNRKCPMCNGRGSIAGRYSRDESDRAYAHALRAFEQDERAKGFAGYGGCWIPASLVGTLPIRLSVAVKHVGARACPDCHGLGFFGCETCHGTGKVKCPNSRCVMGLEVCPVCGGTGKARAGNESRALTQRCTHCRGTGIAVCEECHGQGWVRCQACNGNGESACKLCKGTGSRPLCQRCDGTGLRTCSHCKGSGLYKGVVCPYCHGEKVEACRSCRGTGYGGRH